MEEIYEKLDNLKDVLNTSNVVKNIKLLNKELPANKELVALIDKYNLLPTDNLRQEIIKNQFYQKYKHTEAELNFLILEINNELKKITKKDKCGL